MTCERVKVVLILRSVTKVYSVPFFLASEYRMLATPAGVGIDGSCSENETDQINNYVESEYEVDVELDEEDEDLFFPSISDQLVVGFGRHDRACQTKTSEIVELKDVSNVVSALVADVSVLEKNLSFAKVSIKAEYEKKLEDAVAELYERVNHRMVEIENLHEERVDIVRRSYKTQLSNALTKLSKDYHKFYGNRDAEANLTHKKKLQEMENQQKLLRRNELAQKEMYEMMKQQMEDTINNQQELPSRKSSVLTASAFVDEINELKESVKDYEARIDYLEDLLEETNRDNLKLNGDIEELNNQYHQEHKQVLQFAAEIKTLKSQIEQEKEIAKNKLKEQEANLKKEMHSQLANIESRLKREAQQQVDSVKRSEAEKLYKQKLLEGKRLKELREQHEKEKVVTEPPVETDVAALQAIERKQRVEIARLQREIDQLKKMYDMKVRILTEHIHKLKDEMFLRTTLQRQAAKVKLAALAYIKKGATVSPLGILSADEQRNLSAVQSPRKYQLPRIIQGPKCMDGIDMKGVEVGSREGSPNVPVV